jgi:hypothetical protein
VAILDDRASAELTETAEAELTEATLALETEARLALDADARLMALALAGEMQEDGLSWRLAFGTTAHTGALFWPIGISPLYMTGLKFVEPAGDPGGSGRGYALLTT